jgi:tetratricopeptide (TPR) repeat protein
MKLYPMNPSRSLALILLHFFFLQPLSAQVKVYQGQETIPTYQLGPNETSPIFYTGRGVQGAAGHYYPYPAQISLGEVITEVTYDMVYLENEYLKVTIIPALGGKLFSAIDKTNGHEIFHRNSTIKPDLIGTLGAWISGGIEWCFPHHHRTSTFMPADYRIVENQDGSATVWVGETEKSLRLRGVIGITLRPGSSCIEADYRLTNPNPVTRNFKFWANVAVTADEDFRTFWPPSQEIAVFHNNSSFTHWPISHEIYRGVDYTEGVDLTWWKNHPSPVSFFFWQGEEGFIGGYNYADRAGLVHVGDTYKSRASKLWQFGPGLEGQNARRKLTDDGKAYVELMTGTFSNNQPDYSWFAPHMVKSAKHYWYPLKELEIAKNATRNAAVTLQMRDGKTVFYGVNTSQRFDDAKLVLTYGGEVVVSESITVDPAHPYTATWRSMDELDEYRIRLAFMDADGSEIVAYTPYKQRLPELPEQFDEFKPAGDYETVEDLYLAGRSVEQFSRPYLNPDDYYLKALQISPTDYRVNLALGIRRVNQWRFAEAEEYFRTAAEKLQYEYIQIKEGELYYYWALAQRAQGKLREAFRNFSYAAYHYAWFSAANYQMAQMESERGNLDGALEFIDEAYSTNSRDAGIVVLYSALLRKAGRGPEAMDMVHRAIEFDPLNYALLYEQYLLTGTSPIEEMQLEMQDVENNYMEIATNYLNAGMFGEAVRLFSGVPDSENPLFFYYQAFALARSGKEEEAVMMVASAKKMGYEYIFPYRMESERVLRYAILTDPSNPFGHYLLGNLLYDYRPDEAVAEWEAAISIEPHMPMVWRNLAFGAFYQQGAANQAIGYLTRAINTSPDNPLWYSELVTYYEASDRDPHECMSLLEANQEIVKRNVSAPQDLVRLYNLNGEYDKAIQLLDSHHFRTWEGGRSIYWHHVDAHVLKSLELRDQGAWEEAIDQLERAMEYPENLEVGKPLNDERNALVYYVMGTVYEMMGKQKQALNSYEQCMNCQNSRSWPDLAYYQGLANRKAGNTGEAEKIFNRLEERGKRMLESGEDGTGTVVDGSRSVEHMKSLSEAYYLQGLASLGKDEQEKATEMFTRAIEEFRYNLWAKYFLATGIE